MYMTKTLDQNDTFNTLRYKRFGIHSSYPLKESYTYWVNDLGQLHREDGPAIITTDGSKYWLLNGNWHRENGPAYEGNDGTKEWWVNGKRHREDGPAIECHDGTKQWWVNEKFIRSE